jgi:hypothetical protein
MMNNKTKRNLRKVVAGGLMALTLTTIVPFTANAKVVDPPIVFSVQQPTK